MDPSSLTVRPLSEGELRDLDEARRDYSIAIVIGEHPVPTRVLEKVDALTALTGSEQFNLNDKQANDRVYWLAVAWGDAVSVILGWSWQMLVRGDRETLAIVSPDRGLVVPVFLLIRRLLGEKPVTPPSTVYTSLLNGYYVGLPGSLKVVL